MPVSAQNLGRLIELIADDTISGRIAKEVFEEMVETGHDPEAIVAEKGLEQITDSSEIAAAVDRVITEIRSRQLNSGRKREGSGLVCRAGDESHSGQSKS